MTGIPTLTPDGYHCPACDTPHPTATEAVICHLSHERRETP